MTRTVLFNKKFSTGVVLFAFVLLFTVFGPLAYPIDPLEQNLFELLRPPGIHDSWFHPLGTDAVGRDILSRVISGGQVSLLVGITSVLIACTVGVFLGLASGYFGGWIDRAIMRLVDLQLAFPSLLLAIFASAAFGKSISTLIIIIALNGWMIYARTVRSQVLVLREREFVLAAHSVGATHLRIIYRHLLPNLAVTIVVLATTQVGAMIIAESSMSFLGFGVQPPTPSWGYMLGEGRNYLTSAWWLAAFPGFAIFSTVFAINLVGEGLRDKLTVR